MRTMTRPSAEVRTDSAVDSTLLCLLPDARERKVLARSAGSVPVDATPANVLAATNSENYPASPRYQARLRDDITVRRTGGPPR